MLILYGEEVVAFQAITVFEQQRRSALVYV
jgi:hypothetical protein